MKRDRPLKPQGTSPPPAKNPFTSLPVRDSEIPVASTATENTTIVIQSSVSMVAVMSKDSVCYEKANKNQRERSRKKEAAKRDIGYHIQDKSVLDRWIIDYFFALEEKLVRR